jgi:hypothetical protein
MMKTRMLLLGAVVALGLTALVAAMMVGPSPRPAAPPPTATVDLSHESTPPPPKPLPDLSGALADAEDPGAVEEAGGAIPQDPKRQEQRRRDILAWNRRTLGGAYERVGKKDPRWDGPAREALDAAARHFSREIDPVTMHTEVHSAAKKALEAGCDDPLVRYVHARSSSGVNFPGTEEYIGRAVEAAAAMEHSDYPPFRRAIALYIAGGMPAADGRGDEARRESARMLDAALALLPRSVAEDERCPDPDHEWSEIARSVFEAYVSLDGDLAAAFEKVDAVLSGVPSLAADRLGLKGAFLIKYAWEARGIGRAHTVTEEGWEKMQGRLTEARRALLTSWKLRPDHPRTATSLIAVNMGLEGDREDMERWFARAMEADGDYDKACWAKMLWLDPKWHGSHEEVLAFGRACRATGNWRSGITLLGADAHLRVAASFPQDQMLAYYRSPAVWDEINKDFQQYLGHFSADVFPRSRYAGLCYLCRHYPEAEEQFRILGEDLVGSENMPAEWLKQARDHVARVMEKRRERAAAGP